LDPIISPTSAPGEPGALRPDRCAVVVIDLQNDYCHEDGAFGRMGFDLSRIRAAVARVEELVDAAHEHGVPVIFVRTTHGEWSDTPGWVKRPRNGSTASEGRIPLVEEGTWGAELYRLVPEERDRLIVKHRYSSFAFTPLELALRAKGRDTVVLAGATTHVCVEATAVDALMLGFHTVLVSECAVAPTPELDASAREDFADHIGTIVALEDLCRSWRTGASA
jgi:ureidoacrylate peracid hydrolase